MDRSGSPPPGRQGRACRRGTAAALLTATVLLALPAAAAADHEGGGQRFASSQEACDFIATQARGKAFLCPLSLPARVASERSRFVVDEAEARLYGMTWRPGEGRGRLAAYRFPKRFMRLFKSFAAEEGRPREIEVRGGRRAIRLCVESLCFVAWRERRSAYLVFGRQRDGSRQRLRRDLRVVARAFDVIQPNPGPPPPPPHQPEIGFWRFATAAGACAFLLDRTQNPPVLCPLALRDRFLPRRRFELVGLFEGPPRWYLSWSPEKAGGRIWLSREPKRPLRRSRRNGATVRETTVRGRPAVRSCGRFSRRGNRARCRLVWREHGSTYTIFRVSRGRSRERARVDLRAVARSLEPVSPDPGG